MNSTMPGNLKHTDITTMPSARPIPTRHDVYPFIDSRKTRGSLVGKVALITGSGRGIGFEIAKTLASAGASIACVARTKAQLDDVVETIRKTFHVLAVAITADVKEEAAPVAVIAKVEQELGPVDILINALPRMIQRRCGTIISIGSRSAVRTAPYSTAYSASKAALLRFHQNLDCEIRRHGICGYFLQPGNVLTSIAHQPGAINLETAMEVPGLKNMLQNTIGAATESQRLAAHTIVWLCVDERAKMLSGKYVNVEQDIEAVMADIIKGDDSRIKLRNLYSMKLEELHST